MSDSDYLKTREARRRRRERFIIIFLLLLIVFATFLETQLLKVSSGQQLSNTFIIFGLINLNVILLLLLIFLILRNVVKLYFERRHKVLGSGIRIKLITAFVGIALLPTILLFLAALAFLYSSTESWFSERVGQTLEESLELARAEYSQISQQSTYFCGRLALNIKERKLCRPDRKNELLALMTEKREEYQLSSVEVFTPELESLVRVVSAQVPATVTSAPPYDLLKKSRQEGPQSRISQTTDGAVVWAAVPIAADSVSGGEPQGLLLVSYLIPRKLADQIQRIARATSEYQQLLMLKNPLRTGYLVPFVIITLLIIFSATWLGFYLAKDITIPIQNLAEATQKVAAGDLDAHLEVSSKDELGLLMEYFNKMTSELKSSQLKLEEANLLLQRSNEELEQRRRYMEFILSNIGAAVVSLDEKGRVSTINAAAERLLDVKFKKAQNRRLQDVLETQYLEAVEELLQELERTGGESLEKQVTLSIKSEIRTILIYLTRQQEEGGGNPGMILVMEDISNLLKVQRMMAWREVARRIAHEIKNPLTPIQLSAQRLRKRYPELLEGKENVFDEATKVIINQVEELRNLVSEFSNFARLPDIKPVPLNLNQLLEEALSIYQGTTKGVEFSFQPDPSLPVMPLDRDQMKRALINILDNAVAAVAETGRIEATTSYIQPLQLVRLEIADTGCGIPAEIKGHLFEPYISSKASGTGLGLTIVNTIITDHHGYVRIKDNQPRGTRVIIELPVNV